MRDQARRDLEAFAHAALDRLVERDGARFFCDFCSPAKPTDAHDERCPVLLALPYLRDDGARPADARLPLDPLPLSSDAEPSKWRRQT